MQSVGLGELWVRKRVLGSQPTLYHMMSGSGFPSTTTAKRGVSPSWASMSSMMDSKRGASAERWGVGHHGAVPPHCHWHGV